MHEPSNHRLMSPSSAWAAPFALPVLLLAAAVASPGCNAIRNSWLDPTTLGAFDRTAMLEIRTSLTLEDTPRGIPGALNPSPDDLVVEPVDYPISAGDTLAIEIYELRQRAIPFQTQVVVSTTGSINLPVVGRLEAAGMTAPQLEMELAERLQRENVLVSPEVTVNPLFLQKGTYSVFGIGVSASNNAPLRAGTFPIRRPDLRILEAINLVGGLNEFVTEVYVFRNDEFLTPDTSDDAEDDPSPAPSEHESHDEQPAEETPGGTAEPSPSETAERELIDAVVAAGDEPPRETAPVTDEQLDALEPDPTQPFLWVNGEFVENPDYRPVEGDMVTASSPPSFDTAMPAVNWARIAGETAYRVIHISADRLRSGERDANIVVRAGDVIRIVSGEIGVYYMMGQVNRVGAFAFNAEPITLKAAIAAAGGLSGLAWPDRCTVYRRIGQREQMIQVDLDRIFAGKDPDFMIRRGDIINVGTHPFAPFLQRIRAWTLPNPVNNVGYSFTYARNYADIDAYSARLNPANEPDRFPSLFP
ncbi:MAG: polysaccharide biosynthesis/export family protein [Phycisphaerae bacterium]